MRKLVECVPNFSEGRDRSVIDRIADAISSVEGIKVLNVDMGFDTNRSVVTFVGDAENIVTAAYRAVAKAAELIDMSRQTGEHPRMGATRRFPLHSPEWNHCRRMSASCRGACRESWV